MINILISSLGKTVLNSKTIFQIFWQIMPIKLVFLNICGFGIIYNVRFDQVSLNAVSCQTADSTVSVCTSKEPEMKGLKQLCYD